MSTECVHKKLITHVDRHIESLAVVVEESRILSELLKMSNECQASLKHQRCDHVRRCSQLGLRGFIRVFG